MSPLDRFLINRNGTQYGPYTMDEAKRYLKSGNLVLTDLAWDEENSEWIPLDQMLSRELVEPPPPEPPRPRKPGVLVLMAILWWIVFTICFFVAGSFFAGFVIGLTHPRDPDQATMIVGEISVLPIVFGSLAFAVWLTMAGRLPGTRR